MNNYFVKDLVSIIMPSWNTEAYIGLAIQSVLNQSYELWELIIVDDCSTDNTENVVKTYCTDDRIRFIKNDKNLGAAMTRNRALREARGEWVAFLDSDDLWKPSKLMMQIEFMKRNGFAFSYHKYEKIDESGQALYVEVSGPRVITRRKMYHYGWPGCLTFMYNAKQIGLVQIVDIKKNNDYAILLKLCKKANCYLLSENLAEYRIRAKSISHDKLLKKVKSHYDLFNKCDGQSKIKSIAYASLNMIFGVYKKLYYERKILNDRE